MQSVIKLSRLALGIALGITSYAGVAAETMELGNVEVVGDWLGEAKNEDVKNHPGARTVIREQTIEESGASNVREVLRRVPGVQVQESNGTGGSDISLNVGVRGLTSRLSPRSTILQDGIPLAVAPYGQPQLSLAPTSLGNLESIDVVRGGGSVRYGPQNVGGIINFVTRGIPEEMVRDLSFQTESSPAQGGFYNRTNAFIGGTADNGLGMALLYSGVRGDTYRDHSDTEIDDVMLKARYQLSDIDELSGSLQYYEADADMPGGLTTAEFEDDPYQSSRPFDHFDGERKQAVLKYTRTPDSDRTFEITTFYNTSSRGSTLTNGNPQKMTWLRKFPREYEVFGIEPRYSQIFLLGESSHEVGVGYRYMEEDSQEKRYDRNFAAGANPWSVPKRLATYNTAATEAHAAYIDDRIDIGNWTITPGVRYEQVRVTSDNHLTGDRREQRYSEPLPSLNTMYHLSEAWKLYANYNTSFGSIQHIQLSQDDDNLTAEKAHTYELGTRYDDGIWTAELTYFHILFEDQLEIVPGSQPSAWANAGETRHRGFEMAGSYEFSALDPRLAGLSAYASLALTKATREEGENQGNDLPFYSRQVATLGLRYATGPWTWNVDGYAQSRQFADSANTRPESANGSLGEIPGYGFWNGRGEYAFGPQLANLKVAVGVKNIFDRQYYTRSTDNNLGKYLGQPRTLYLQTSVAF
ncbi:Fe(3+) dicitrate transport protein FecA precursor [compost metagenome]